jgi:hypothetical protein
VPKSKHAFDMIRTCNLVVCSCDILRCDRKEPSVDKMRVKVKHSHLELLELVLFS